MKKQEYDLDNLNLPERVKEEAIINGLRPAEVSIIWDVMLTVWPHDRLSTPFYMLIKNMFRPSFRAEKMFASLNLPIYEARRKPEGLANLAIALHDYLILFNDQLRESILETLFGKEALPAAWLLYALGDAYAIERIRRLIAAEPNITDDELPVDVRLCGKQAADCSSWNFGDDPDPEAKHDEDAPLFLTVSHDTPRFSDRGTYQGDNLTEAVAAFLRLFQPDGDDTDDDTDDDPDLRDIDVEEIVNNCE